MIGEQENYFRYIPDKRFLQKFKDGIITLDDNPTAYLIKRKNVFENYFTYYLCQVDTNKSCIDVWFAFADCISRFLENVIGVNRRRCRGNSRRPVSSRIKIMWQVVDNLKYKLMKTFYGSKKIDKRDFKDFNFTYKKLRKCIIEENDRWVYRQIEIAEKKGINGVWTWLPVTPFLVFFKMSRISWSDALRIVLAPFFSIWQRSSATDFSKRFSSFLYSKISY